MTILRNFLKNETADDVENNIINNAKNWYEEQYETALVQRNFLILFSLGALFAIIFSILLIRDVTLSKNIKPFIIEVEEKSGITNVVNPLSRRDLLTNEALNTYFIVKYLTARETYDAGSYRHNYYKVVRLMSTSSVFSIFNSYLASDTASPIKRYGALTQTSIKIRSIQFLEPGKVAQIRFVVTEEGRSNKSYNKIATINFSYNQTEMTADERYINPLGFIVNSYKVDNETL